MILSTVHNSCSGLHCHGVCSEQPRASGMRFKASIRCTHDSVQKRRPAQSGTVGATSAHSRAQILGPFDATLLRADIRSQREEFRHHFHISGRDLEHFDSIRRNPLLSVEAHILQDGVLTPQALLHLRPCLPQGNFDNLALFRRALKNPGSGTHQGWARVKRFQLSSLLLPQTFAQKDWPINSVEATLHWCCQS